MARTLSLPALAGGTSDAVLLALDITAMILTGQLRAGDPVPADEEHAARAAKILLKRLGLIQRPPQGRYYLVAPAISHRPAPAQAPCHDIREPLPDRDAESAPHPEEGTSPMPGEVISTAGGMPAGPPPPGGGPASRRPNG